MRVLGIDPGMTRLGIGVVEDSGNDIEFVTHGMISHPRDPQLKFNEHLNKGIHQIALDLPRLLDLVKPQFVCGETVPAGRLGMNSELVVAAITTCKIITFQFGIPWYDLAANTVKKTVTGDGKATKAKVKNAVIDRYPIVGERHKQLKKEQKQMNEKATGLPQDVFDAIAIAITGTQKYVIDQRPAPQSTERSL